MQDQPTIAQFLDTFLFLFYLLPIYLSQPSIISEKDSFAQQF
jgi:hypothetical protein